MGYLPRDGALPSTQPIPRPVQVRPLPPSLVLRREEPDDEADVEALYDVVFGPGRYSRTSARVREIVRHDPRTSFVADRRGIVLGAIRQTPVTVGGAPAYLLGPLAVAETSAKQGIGRALLNRSIDAARSTRADAIVLVGDLAYYEPSGFARVGDAILMPGPTERHRLLMLPLRRAVSGRLAADPWPEPSKDPQ